MKINCDLDYQLAKYILPRLKGWYERERSGYPYGFKNFEEWDKVLKQMIEAFELLIEDSEGNVDMPIDKLYKKIIKGTTLFGKYFSSLWD